MKKIILLIAAMLAFSACDTSKMYEPATNERGITEQLISSNGTSSIIKVTVEGHEYLMFEGYSVGYGTPISVVHSASCPCHNQE